MKVSDFFSLGLSQPSLEFLDVDTVRDTRVFVDPHAFRYINSDWARECVSLLEDFYDELLDTIRSGDRARGLALLAYAGESNEVHLGLSSAESRGSGIGTNLAEELYDALSSSRAVASGLATDVEETVLFVEGILHDRVSDMTINVIRSQLIAFTQEMCDIYGMPLTPSVDSGPMWNRHTHTWVAGFVELPIVDTGKLLLVPRAVVRKRGTFDPGDYMTHFVLPYMVDKEIARQGPLVRHRAINGRYRGEPYVTKKSVRESDSRSTKAANFEETQENPTLLDDYRASREGLSEPPPHDELATLTESEQPDWDQLLAEVLAIPGGGSPNDDLYHRAVQKLLTALFYPALDFPKREHRIHEGRKRIDIVYANLAASGFFHWLRESQHVASGSIVVECKNYTKALTNTEYDQITGRFSNQRGWFGLLLYRGYADDKAAVIRHFRDTALDGRGYVLALDDEDLKELVEARKNGEGTMFRFLYDRFQELI